MGKTALTIVPKLFDMGTTPCSVLRTVPRGTGYGWVQSYVERRLPEIDDPEEQKAVMDYLYNNASLPGSGEYALNRILTHYAMGRKPIVRRIPHLKLPRVTFLYGQSDWMDSTGGLQVEQACQQIPNAPFIDVYEIPRAGHLLMLENWESFNASVISAMFGITTFREHMPRKLSRGLHPASTAVFDTSSFEPRQPQISVRA